VAYSLGVDLGTAFVGAAVARPGGASMVSLCQGSVVEPALVYLGVDGELATGDTARRRAVSSPDRLGRDIKRRLGDPTPLVLGGEAFAITDLLGALLRDVFRKVAEAEGGPPNRVVLTHPANWGPFRRGLFEEVPAAAGLTGSVTITEPEAAAAHYAASRQLREGQIVAVYDLGGGTFDATVLRGGPAGVEILGIPEGIERLGGVDFDDSVMAYVNSVLGGVLDDLNLADPAALIGAARLRQDCVLAKESLSRDTETTIPVFLPERTAEVRLTRQDFEDMVRAPIESTTEALIRAVRAADVKLADLSAVLLVGGSSRIPLVAEMVAKALGCRTVVDAHPKHAVALGAAIVAGRGADAASVSSMDAFATVGAPAGVRPEATLAAPAADPSVPTQRGPVDVPPFPPDEPGFAASGPGFPPPGLALSAAGSTFPSPGPAPAPSPGLAPPPYGPVGPPPYGLAPRLPATEPGLAPPGPGLPPPAPSLTSDPWSRGLLVPMVIGCAAAVLFGVYGRLHEPAGFAINIAGFSSGQYVKAWLATFAVLFGIVQLATAKLMYGRRAAAPSKGLGALHRWSGRTAVLATVPVAVHCLYALGFEAGTPRVLIHSLLGCVFYGAFVTKMLTLTKRGIPKWALPVLGGLVFTALIGIWSTSALWAFQVKGLHF